MAYVIYTPNALEPTKAEKQRISAGPSIRDVVRSRFPDTGEFPLPTICVLNGEAVLRKDWDRRLQEKDIVNFVTVPGEITTIILVILVVLAIGVTIYTVLNRPKVPGEQPTSDPVFSVKGQQNEIRLGEPIEVNYGRNRIYPSLASRPYYEYRDNDQYQFSLYCIGQGVYDIAAVQIGDTPIDSFQEVSYEIIPPGDPVTLFPSAVYTSPEAGGQTLFGPNEEEYVAPGWQGPFPANPAGTTTEMIQVDVVLPKGLYRISKSGKVRNMTIDIEIEKRAIDDLGNPLGGWSSLTGGPITISGATTTPQRKTYTGSTLSGRYEVRMRRTSDTTTEANAGHDIVWEGLRSYLEEEQDFGDVTLMAVRIRATNNLNDRTAQRFNVVATRKLPIRESGGTWSDPQPTRSIVWALVDVFRANYGGRITDDNFFDWDTLEELDDLYTERGEYFDWTFRDPITVWEAARAVARVGRATPLLAGSLITMKRDGPLEMPVAMFNQENIVKGSFEWSVKLWDYDEHDSVRIEYTDPDTGYKQETVVCTLPGGTTDHPEDIRFPGIQDRDHAYHEGLYIRASRRYLRENATFVTGLEGYIPTFGDLIAVAHDIPNWGQGGYVVHAVQGAGDAVHLYLSEPVTFESGQEHQILLRSANSDPIGPLTVTETTDAQQVIIHTESADIDFLLGGNTEPMLYLFGVANDITKYLRVVKVEPQGGEQIRITAVNEAAIIHTFDSLDAPPLASPLLPINVPALPEIDELIVTQIDSALHIVQASWTAALGAQYYIVQTSEDGEHWQNRTQTTRTAVQLQVYPGELWVRVAAVNEGQGPWIEAQTTVGYLLLLQLVTPWDFLLWRVEWQLVLLATSYLVEVFDNSGSDPVLKRTETRFARSFEYTHEMAEEDDNLVRDHLVMVTPIFENEDSDDAEVPVELEISNAVPTAPQNPQASINTVNLDSVLYDFLWQVPVEDDLITVKLWLSPTNGFDPEVESPDYTFTAGTPGAAGIPIQTQLSIPLDSNDEHPAYYWRVALFDIWGEEIETNITAQQTIPAFP